MVHKHLLKSPFDTRHRSSHRDHRRRCRESFAFEFVTVRHRAIAARSVPPPPGNSLRVYLKESYTYHQQDRILKPLLRCNCGVSWLVRAM